MNPLLASGMLLAIALSGCMTGEDPGKGPIPTLAVAVSYTNATAIKWTDLAADMPAVVAAGMDKAAASDHGRFSQTITSEERMHIKQAYESAWADRYGGKIPYPYVIEREGRTFMIDLDFNV